ncbi:MAG: hypothetical protein QXS81_05085 [Candidatus Micrarchaeaceae archaeon]
MPDRQGLRGSIKFLLFLSSYIPLFVVLAILHYTNALFVIGMAVIIIATLGILGLLFTRSNRIGNYHHAKITDFENINDMSLEYIIAYIFPLLFLNYTDWSVFLALLVIFLTIGYIYIRSDLIYMNPILSLFGYNIYKAQTNEGGIVIISKREDTREIVNHKLVQLANRVYLGR